MRKCDHIAIGRIAGQSSMCRLVMLPDYIINLVNRIYWVGVGVPPDSEFKKCAKEFMKYKYCPKCGTKLDFAKVKVLFEDK